MRIQILVIVYMLSINHAFSQDNQAVERLQMKFEKLISKAFDFDVNRIDYFSIDPHNQEVKASKVKPDLSEQKIVLSYIFLNYEFLDPIILKGEPKASQELIDFLALKDYNFDYKLKSEFPVTVYFYQE